MRKSILIFTVVIVAAAAILLTLVPLQSQDKGMKLRLTVMWAPQHWATKLLTEMGNDIEKATAGRVSVTVFPSNTLSPPMQVYDNTVKGVVDIGTSLLAYSPGRLPLSEVLQQPLGFRNGYQSTKCANEYFKKFQPKEFNDVKVMFLHAAAPGFFMTKKSC